MFEKDFDFTDINDNEEFFEKLSHKDASNKLSSEKISDVDDKEECKTPIIIEAENELPTNSNSPTK